MRLYLFYYQQEGFINMKKKLIFLPLLMLVLASCVPNNNSSSDTASDTSSDTSSATSGEDGSDTISDTSSGTSSDTSSDTSTEPIEKQEIDPSGLNAILGFDVYAQLPKIYSNDYEVGDYSSEEYPVDVYIDLFDWDLDDALAYDAELETALDYDDSFGYIIQDNLFIFIYQDTENFDVPVFGLNIYSVAEAAEKEEIDPSGLNAILGFDVYALLPEIYSNDYEVGDYSSEEYPVDVYIDLYDWTLADALAYDESLAALLVLDEYYGYVLDENLYVYVNYDSEYSAAYINIYSDGEGGGEAEVSAVWPADAIAEFFGSPELGALVPSFESDADFSYYVVGEGEYAELIIYTDYETVDGEDIYVAALENNGWIVDDTMYDVVGYIAYDAEEQISLVFYWYNGVIYWSFMEFYHEPEPEPADGTASLDFSTSDQRQSLDTEQQVWLSGDHVVTLTIDKGSATSSVVDYTNPLRVYANHVVTFSIEEGYVFDSIVITANSSSYADVVSASSITGGTASVEGSVVTITAEEGAEVISFVASAQTRWNSLEVNYSEVA